MPSVTVALIFKQLLIICFFYSWNSLDERTCLLCEISEINSKILICTNSKIVETLLFGDTLFNQFDNKGIFNATITFIVSSKRFWWHSFFSD